MAILRGHDNLLDQRPQHLAVLQEAGLGALLPGRYIARAPGHDRIDHLRMQQWRRSSCVGKECFQLFPARFQPIHFVFHGRVIRPVGNRIDSRFNLLVDEDEFQLRRVNRRVAFHS